MNNGMFVEMCAYVANRDMKKGHCQHEVPENEPEPDFTRVEPSLMTKSGLELVRFWIIVKAFYKRLFMYAPKKGSEGAQSKQFLA